MNTKIKDDILRLLSDRSPNYVRREIILSRLNKYSRSEVDQVLDSLISESSPQVIGLKGAKNPYRALKLKNDKDIPIKKYIRVGDIEIPRILSSDAVPMLMEDINESIERLSEHNEKLEDRFKALMEKTTERYWGNIISIFGLFVAIFSLINFAIPRKDLPASYSFKEILLAGIAQSLPVAIVLSVFVLVLVLIFRRR